MTWTGDPKRLIQLESCATSQRNLSRLENRSFLEHFLTRVVSVRLIVTDVVQVVESSVGLACCLQGMSRTSSPNPESIRAEFDVVLSGVARDPRCEPAEKVL